MEGGGGRPVKVLGDVLRRRGRKWSIAASLFERKKVFFLRVAVREKEGQLISTTYEATKQRAIIVLWIFCIRVTLIILKSPNSNNHNGKNRDHSMI